MAGTSDARGRYPMRHGAHLPTLGCLVELTGKDSLAGLDGPMMRGGLPMVRECPMSESKLACHLARDRALPVAA